MNEVVDGKTFTEPRAKRLLNTGLDVCSKTAKSSLLIGTLLILNDTPNISKENVGKEVFPLHKTP